jgi:hypothetical protein
LGLAGPRALPPFSLGLAALLALDEVEVAVVVVVVAGGREGGSGAVAELRRRWPVVLLPELPAETSAGGTGTYRGGAAIILEAEPGRDGGPSSGGWCDG